MIKPDFEFGIIFNFYYNYTFTITKLICCLQKYTQMKIYPNQPFYYEALQMWDICRVVLREAYILHLLHT